MVNSVVTKIIIIIIKKKMAIRVVPDERACYKPVTDRQLMCYIDNLSATTI